MKMNRKTALICVDLQKNLTVEGGGNYYPTATEMIDRVARRINEFRDRGVQIVYIWSMPHLSSGLCSNGPKLNPELAGRMVPHPEWGRELDDRLTVKEEDWIIRKFTYSAFWNTPLLEKLQQAGVENVLVCGIKTNVCCRQTAIDSVSHNFKTFMVSDMTSTNDEKTKAFHLDEINRYFAKVIDSQEVLRRLDNGEF